MKLNSDEIKCPHCESGRVVYYDEDIYCSTKECNYCLGKGKLDWIEQVVGVKKENAPANWNKPSYPFSLASKVLFSNLLEDWKKSMVRLYEV